MGISRKAMELYKELYDRHLFDGMSSVIELGAQELHVEDPKDCLVFLNAIGKENASEIMCEDSVSGDKRKLRDILFPPPPSPYAWHLPARHLYEWLGFTKYRCIDINGMFGALVFDLNKDICEHYGYKEKFDLTTNHGTIEHIINLTMGFANMHNLTRKGGLMIHGIPFQGYVDHGFYNMQPGLFIDLASANNYVCIGMWLSARDMPILLPYSKEILQYIDTKIERSYNSLMDLFCVLKKTEDTAFQMPYQGCYASSAKLGGTELTEGYQRVINRIEFSQPRKKSLWRRMVRKILEKTERQKR